jgi:hypothetical protein
LGAGFFFVAVVDFFLGTLALLSVLAGFSGFSGFPPLSLLALSPLEPVLLSDSSLSVFLVHQLSMASGSVLIVSNSCL